MEEDNNEKKNNIDINWGKFLHLVTSVGFASYVLYKSPDVSVKSVVVGFSLVGLSYAASVAVEENNKNKRK